MASVASYFARLASEDKSQGSAKIQPPAVAKPAMAGEGRSQSGLRSQKLCFGGVGCPAASCVAKAMQDKYRGELHCSAPRL